MGPPLEVPRTKRCWVNGNGAGIVERDIALVEERRVVIVTTSLAVVSDEKEMAVFKAVMFDNFGQHGR